MGNLKQNLSFCIERYLWVFIFSSKQRIVFNFVFLCNILFCREKASGGQKVHHFDEFWFFTDPEKMMYHCLEDRPQWQLLQNPWTVYTFVNVPYFTTRYHDSGFKLVSKHAAILKSEKG